MIIDCFPFFNELDIVELRFRTLEDVVDQWIVFQSYETHSGLPKPLYFNPEDPRWSPWRSRIRCVTVASIPHVFSRWERERAPRHLIPEALAPYHYNDVVLLSDVDEFLDPDLVREWAPHVQGNHWIGFDSAVYYYYLNLRSTKDFPCISLVSVGLIRGMGGQWFREELWNRRVPQLIQGGWHFSYQGGPAAIRTKLQSFAHEEIDIPEYHDLAYLAQCINDQKTFFYRARRPRRAAFNPVPLSEMPRPVREHPESYAHLLIPGTV